MDAPLSGPEFTRELVDAAMSANPERVADLLKGVSKLRRGAHLGESPLAAAAKAGCLRCAALIAPLSPAGALDCRGLDAVCCAAAAGDLPMLSLLAPFTDPHFRDRKGRSALDWAAMSNSTACLEELLRRHPRPWAATESLARLAPHSLDAQAPGWRAVALAIAAGSLDAVQSLIERAAHAPANPDAWLKGVLISAQALVRDAEPSILGAREALALARSLLEARAIDAQTPGEHSPRPKARL